MRSAKELKNLETYGYEELYDIVWLLRSEDGCPWDRAQDHHSIRKNLIEEAYEVAEALDREDAALLREELGDLMLQVVLHADMEQRAGRPGMEAVFDGICRKLIFRHPHIFGEDDAVTPEEALAGWEARKMQEKGQKTVSEGLDRVTRTLPGLMRAQKIVKKAKKASALPENALQGDDLVSRLLALCDEANDVGIDLEEALYGRLEDLICQVKEEET
ncbi:MAG: MazG family protein [Ruminococcaceae bacterium]|nr:MazG family protein [Oscillospiraceae bacterium]